MNVGSNLLALALTVINKQKVMYYEFIKRELNVEGVYVDVFRQPYEIRGSFQPVNVGYYAQMGLDFAKTYVMWWDPKALTRELERDTTGDKIKLGCNMYQVMSANDWSCIDGWVGVMLVKVPKDE